MEDPVSLSDTEDYSLEGSSMMHTSRDGQDYLIMTIELGDGQQEHIKIHATDDPIQLAHEFIQSHQLSQDLEQSLANLIKQNIGLLDKRSQPSPFIKSSISNYNSLTKEVPQFKSFEMPSILEHTPKINKKSLMITSKQSRGDIHERLYKLATRKKPRTVQKEKSVSEKSAPSFYNPGEILYIRGMAMQHSKKRMVEEIGKARDLKNSKELTFKPQINPGQKRYDERTEDILIKKAKEYEVHKKILKEKYEQEETKECSFQPNPRKPVNFDRNVHDVLYQDSLNRQEKMHDLAHMKLFSFEPNADKPKGEKTESREEFIGRLLNSKQKLYEEMEKLRSLQDVDYDITTGQKFFSPEVNQNSEASHRKRDKNIWQYLYDMKDNKKENIKKILKESEKIWEESANVKKVSNHSEKVFQKYRDKQYKKLFRALDGDNDGMISSENIDLSGVDEIQLEVLSPFLEHLLSSGDSIDFELFVLHLEELRSHLDLATKSAILKREKKIEEIEFDPHPQLSPNTIEICERIRNDEGIYERGVKETIVKQLRNEKIKEIQEDKTVKECSFRPTLINGGRIGYQV